MPATPSHIPDDVAVANKRAWGLGMQQQADARLNQEGRGGTSCANVGSSDGRCDVVIGRGNVSGEGAKGVEGGLIAPLQLLGHVLWDFLHGHMAWALVHDL